MRRPDRTYPGLAVFEPRVDVLPERQRAMWRRLGMLPPDAVLYGGTAIALRLGHRTSVDFDFFVPRSFQPGELRREIAGLEPTETAMTADDTLVVRVDGVLVGLFGVRLPAVAAPDVAADTGIPVASLIDLAATKLKAVLDRAESKDYLDVAALLEAGLDLGDMLGAARSVFGEPFAPLLALKALTSFDDGDLPTLDPGVRSRLSRAAAAVDRIPVVPARYSEVLPKPRERT